MSATAIALTSTTLAIGQPLPFHEPGLMFFWILSFMVAK